MPKVTYSEKLRDPRWQKKRLEVMQRADFKCEDCGAADKTLNVHHCLYVSDREPWEYDNGMLRCLCEPCHGTRPIFEKDTILLFKLVLARLTAKQIYELQDQLSGACFYLSEHGKGDTIVVAAPHALKPPQSDDGGK